MLSLKFYYIGKPSSDENLSDYVPDAFDFNTPEKTADICEKEMNGSKEKHSVTKRNAVNYSKYFKFRFLIRLNNDKCIIVIIFFFLCSHFNNLF